MTEKPSGTKRKGSHQLREMRGEYLCDDQAGDPEHIEKPGNTRERWGPGVLVKKTGGVSWKLLKLPICRQRVRKARSKAFIHQKPLRRYNRAGVRQFTNHLEVPARKVRGGFSLRGPRHYANKALEKKEIGESGITLSENQISGGMKKQLCRYSPVTIRTSKELKEFLYQGVDKPSHRSKSDRKT